MNGGDASAERSGIGCGEARDMLGDELSLRFSSLDLRDRLESCMADCDRPC